MKKIGISQRVINHSGYTERRDCLDQRWGSFLESKGLLAMAIPNGLKNPELFFDEVGLDGFILSGGNDLSTLPDATEPAVERDLTEYAILRYAAAKRLPLLGVCRGLQIMNTYLGGSLSSLEGHAGHRHKLQVSPGNILSANQIVCFETNSYHGYGIKSQDLAAELRIMALSADNTVEAAFHHLLPWIGIMWHPERESAIEPHDSLLFNNLFNHT